MVGLVFVADTGASENKIVPTQEARNVRLNCPRILDGVRATFNDFKIVQKIR